MLRLPPVSERSPQVFVIPDDFIQFLGIDASGFYIFRITLAINTSLALAMQATSVKIGVYPIRKSGIDASSISATSVKEFNKQIIARQGKVDKANRAYRMTKITEANIDLTAHMSNDLGMNNISEPGGFTDAVKLNKGFSDEGAPSFPGAGEDITTAPRKKRYFIELMDSTTIVGEDMQEAPLSEPHNNIPTTMNSETYTLTVNRLTRLAGKDPARVLNFDFPIRDTSHAIEGSIKASNIMAYRQIGFHLEQKMRPPSQKNENQISTSLNSLRDVNEIGSFTIGNSELVLRNSLVKKSISPNFNWRVLRGIAPKFEMMNTILKIPASQRGQILKPKLEFNCHNTRGVIIQRRSLGVDIGSLMRAKEIPVLPPIIQVCRTEPGINYLRIRQQDPYAQKVIIYRKTLENVRFFGNERSFVSIGNVSLRYDEGDLEIVDRVSNGSRILYRAISTGRNDRAGSQFASDISSPPRQLKKFANPLSNALDYAILSCSVKTNAIKIRVAVHADDVVACFLQARDITGISIPRINMQPVRVVGDTLGSQLLSINSSDVVTFRDEDIIPNHTYYYDLVLIRSDGRKVTAVGSVIKEFVIPDPGLGFEVSQHVKSELRPMYRVQVIPSKVGLERIVSQLKGLGAAGSFLEGIRDSRDAFSALYRCLVDRKDMKTGEVVRLGMWSMGNFIDDSILARGRTYEYEFTLLKRDIFTILRGVLEESKDPATLKSFARNLRKFRDPLTQKTATLPSNLELLGPTENPDFSFEEKFLRGNTGLTRIKRHTIPAVEIPITNMRIVAPKNGLNTVMWGMDGSTQTVDHFIVFSEVDGIKAPIGTVLNLGNKNGFSFSDTKTSGIVGTKTYSVIPVFTDFTLGNESDPVVAIRKMSISDIEAKT